MQVILETSTFVEGSLHQLSAFASDLQLDGFPKSFKLSSMIGNGQAFYPVKLNRNEEGDLLAVRYKQDMGCVTATIFND